MRPRGARPVPRYQRREIQPGEVCIVYRIVKIADPTDDAFADSLKSRAELGLPPRPRMGEDDELARGISAYTTQRAAAETALRYGRRGRNLGEYVAEIRLLEGQGFEIAEHGAHGHLTIWGDPLMLALHVTDIVAVTTAEEDG